MKIGDQVVTRSQVREKLGRHCTKAHLMQMERQEKEALELEANNRERKERGENPYHREWACKETETVIGGLFIPLSGKNISYASSAKEARGNGVSKSSLSAEEKAVAASLGIPEREFSAQKARGTIAASCASGGSAGLLRGHQEIDRAYKALYQQERHIDPPDRELLDRAMAELKAYNPDDEDTYNRLLRGVLYAVTLLDRAAPPYADQKDIG